jgi:pimeloyl-ACP methyl ester carboxylesterase
MQVMVRIFEEKPLFIVPQGTPVPGACEVRFPTRGGLTLHGCYLRTSRPRRGVILFAPEFGSNCWSCWEYCKHLIEAGFDVFSFTPRNQGASDVRASYAPLQWMTRYEVADAAAALAYLKSRPDADPRGIGLFGISKGACAALFAAARDRSVRCSVTDGMYATYILTVAYMRHWFRIYNANYFLQGCLPNWYYGQIALAAMRKVERDRRCRFPRLERVMHKLAGRPLFMIHGGGDTYIKPEMAQALFDRARLPRELWLVPGAKHNQAIHCAGEEYRQRVLSFFEQQLASLPEIECIPSATPQTMDGVPGVGMLAQAPLVR